jgi:hypothetical protein
MEQNGRTGNMEGMKTKMPDLETQFENLRKALKKEILNHFE